MPNPPKRWFLELDPMGSQYLIISGYATLWGIRKQKTQKFRVLGLWFEV